MWIDIARLAVPLGLLTAIYLIARRDIKRTIEPALFASQSMTGGFRFVDGVVSFEPTIPDVADSPALSSSHRPFAPSLDVGGIMKPDDDLSGNSIFGQLRDVVAYGLTLRTCPACRSQKTQSHACKFLHHPIDGVHVSVDESCIDCGNHAIYDVNFLSWIAIEAARVHESIATASAGFDASAGGIDEDLAQLDS